MVSEEALANRLRAARLLVSVGGLYTHYKHPERTYGVKDLVIDEATEEVAVVYEAHYGAGLIFVRALNSWTESVEWEGKTVPRFRKV